MKGFTLLEVMVAVAVLAIAMAAVIKAGSEMTTNARHLQDRTFAHWVASNVLTQLQAERFWGTGSAEGSTRLGGEEWHWAYQVEETPNPDFRRVDVSVHRTADADHAVATVTGLVSNPELAGTGGALDASDIEPDSERGQGP